MSKKANMLLPLFMVFVSSMATFCSAFLFVRVVETSSIFGSILWLFLITLNSFSIYRNVVFFNRALDSYLFKGE
jgi:hypothetical protein